MKILIADKFPQEALDAFTGLGCDVVIDQNLKEDSLLQALVRENPRILIVRSTKVTGTMLGAGPALSLVIRAGAGFNTIDVETASQRGIYVANCPGKNAVAVAELAMGLILSLDRRIPDNVMDLRAGKWNKQEYSRAEGVLGRTLGIIGTGRIGREVIFRARAFGMNVAAWSRSLTAETARELDVEMCGSIFEVAEKSDFISLHLALTDDTRNLIGAEFFNHMKDGAAFINTSRAEVVDQAALVEALETKNLTAGLDVFAGEPSSGVGEFTGFPGSHPRVYGTHHIGASTNQAQKAVSDETVNIVKTYLETGRVLNCVNLTEKTPAQYLISVRHRNHMGVLAGILRIIRENNINVEKMENIIFAGARGACANIQIDDQLSQKALGLLRDSSDDIYDALQSKID